MSILIDSGYIYTMVRKRVKPVLLVVVVVVGILVLLSLPDIQLDKGDHWSSHTDGWCDLYQRLCSEAGRDQSRKINASKCEFRIDGFCISVASNCNIYMFGIHLILLPIQYFPYEGFGEPLWETHQPRYDHGHTRECKEAFLWNKHFQL